jgi:putative membrane protein
MTETPRSTSSIPFDPKAISRPDPSLMTYYFLSSFVAGPFFFMPLIPLYLKYRSLNYRFDDEGVSMSWGILFRHEINLTYRRIQDIHLTRNFVERWMGLATVAIQTASGSSGPEMKIEGILQASQLRDFLYTKMRGAKGIADVVPAGTSAGSIAAEDEPLALLREIRDLLQKLALREESK